MNRKYSCFCCCAVWISSWWCWLWKGFNVNYIVCFSYCIYYDLLGLGHCESQSPAKWWNNWKHSETYNTGILPENTLTKRWIVTSRISVIRNTRRRPQPAWARRWSSETPGAGKPLWVSADRWRVAPPPPHGGTSSVHNLVEKNSKRDS